MERILYLSCSPRGEAAYSSRMAVALLRRLNRRYPAAFVVARDLAANPPAQVDAGFSAAILVPPNGDRNDSDAPALAVSEVLIGELESCDALVIATPMHNYSVPAVLKAWIDQIVRIHRTFASTPAGKVGRLGDRPVYVVVASGGWFTGPSPTGIPAQPDFLTAYLRAMLGTIGLHDVHFITLQGVARGPDAVARALAAGTAALDRLLPA